MKNKSINNKFIFYMVIGLILLLITVVFSILLGAADMSLKTAWDAVFNFNPMITEHHIIQTLRLPRTVACLIVGSSLSVCGAIMQGTTRNPLADSGLMGISSGAMLSIAICMVFLPQASYEMTMVFAFAGAALATFITYFTASLGKGGASPQRLILAGISISMLFSAFAQYLSIKYHLGHALMYWSAGGTANATWGQLLFVTPFFLIGIIAAIVISPSITILNLGEDVAVGLGLKTNTTKIVSTIIVLLLTGLSVIVIGPVSFVGLIIPHMVRHFVGSDYRHIIPATIVYGALFTLAADIVGRLINKPFETPVGIIFSLIGVPYFLYLSRKQRREFES